MDEDKAVSHLVALSGGKDSTALALRLREIEPRKYIYFCTPTGDELPEMHDHWSRLEDLLESPIIRLHDPENPTIYDLIRHMKMLPNWRARWCTRILKIEVAQQFYNLVKPAFIYVGLRADEAKRQGNKLYDEDITQRFPMRDWGWNEKHVWEYLQQRGVKIPRRTDCAMCFYQRISEWWLLWSEYPELFARIEAIEDELGHTLMSPGKWKNWPHALFGLRREFEAGRVPRGVEESRDKGCFVCKM